MAWRDLVRTMTRCILSTPISTRTRGANQMTSLQHWTDSIGWGGISSGGPSVRSYALPSAQPKYSIGSHIVEPFLPSFGAVFFGPGTRTSFTIEGVDEYWRKRLLASLAALLMPDEGVDDNLDSTMYRLQFYRDQAELPPPPPRHYPNKITSSLGRVTRRPDLVLSDS